jgi:hypothetical protein
MIGAGSGVDQLTDVLTIRINGYGRLVGAADGHPRAVRREAP